MANLQFRALNPLRVKVDIQGTTWNLLANGSY